MGYTFIMNKTDTINVVDIKGSEIKIEGNSPIKVYKTTSSEIILYLSVFLLVTFGIIMTIRFLRIKNRKKEKVIQSLSERELVVAKLIQAGKQNKQIAEELFISLSTVKTHVNNIYKKLKIKNRKEIKSIRFPKENTEG